jgi:hypothetical protein
MPAKPLKYRGADLINAIDFVLHGNRAPNAERYTLDEFLTWLGQELRKEPIPVEESW